MRLVNCREETYTTLMIFLSERCLALDSIGGPGKIVQIDETCVSGCLLVLKEGIRRRGYRTGRNSSISQRIAQFNLRRKHGAVSIQKLLHILIE